MTFFTPQADAAERWKVFTSEEYGFRVSYPGSWYPFALNFGGLDILSFPRDQRIQGVVIRDGGAEIVVVGRQPGVSDVNEWIAKDRQSDDSLWEERDIPVPNTTAHGCAQLIRTISETDVGGTRAAIQVSTSLYCVADDKPFRLAVLNWKGDPKQATYQELLLNMALSLTTEK